jgi:hypothetical protein
VIFSYSEYKKILQAFKGRWISFYDVTDKPFVLMRHDVEFSVDRAHSLGVIESDWLVKSTFNFQVSCETYNIFSFANRKKVRALKELGHEIGLHFYGDHILEGSVDELILGLNKQRAILEAAIDIEVSTFSFHRPKKWMLEIRDDHLGGMLNQYGKSFFEFSSSPKTIKYIADSRHSWDYGHPLNFTDMSRIQILTHPDEWSLTGSNEVDNFRALKSELSRNISEAFLAESPRNFSKYKGQI